MKRITPLLVIAFTLLFAMQSQAKIWRVNNNPSLDADVLQATTLFDNVNNANNPEAANGDSIYFEPSTTNYNGFSANKQVVMLGYGYFLNENTGFQVNTNNAKVSSLDFVAGSSGSSVSGLEVAGAITCTNVSNVLITRCYMYYFIISGYTVNATGIRVDKCYIRYQLYDQSINAAVTSIITNIENCIISDITNNATTGIGFGNKTRGLLRNNTFNNVGQLFCYNFYIANNIVVGNTNWGTVTQSGNNIYRNNILSYPSNTNNSFVSNIAPNSGNVFAQNMTPVFTGSTDNTYNGTTIFNNRIDNTASTLEGRFELKVSSPALTAGESGTTFGGATVTTPACGAYGVNDPYRKGGFPAIPRIYALSVPASVPNGAPNMTISVSSSSNN